VHVDGGAAFSRLDFLVDAAAIPNAVVFQRTTW
jgi:hypothetical protein